jgi:hypothetical protein
MAKTIAYQMLNVQKTVCRGPFLDPELSTFVRIFKFYLVT